MKRFIQTWCAFLASLVFFALSIHIAPQAFELLQDSIQVQAKEEWQADSFYGQLIKDPDSRYDYMIKDTNVRIQTTKEDIEWWYVTLNVRYTWVGDNFTITSWVFDKKEPIANQEVTQEMMNNFDADYTFVWSVTIQPTNDVKYKIKDNDGNSVYLWISDTLSDEITWEDVEFTILIRKK